ncbi:MAG: ChbG/HpnK family deacetylase [Actinobacteria bacterium]|nr:ChbG/HpnK family deacetylase [Actinomycetota bacterium]
MTDGRRLIVNADDFGLSAGVNRGIAQAHEQGILTSASLMVRAGHAAEAAAYAQAHPELSVGLHVDLGEWHYTGEHWVAAYEVVDTADDAEVGAEVAAQVERFCALTGRAPTHLDAHQHAHRSEPAKSIVLAFGRRFGVPVRSFTPGLRYEGGFYGQSGKGEPWPEGIAVGALCELLRALPPGASELGCHPGIDDDSGSSYCAERTVETATLCDPRVRAVVAEEGIALRSYLDWRD